MPIVSGKSSGEITFALYQPVFAIVAMISDFAKKFMELEEENAKLKLELEEAKKLAVDARLKADIAEKEKAKMKKSLDKEVAAREEAKAKTADQEVQLRNAIGSLLSKFHRNPSKHFFCLTLVLMAIFLDFFQLLPIFLSIEAPAFE